MSKSIDAGFYNKGMFPFLRIRPAIFQSVYIIKYSA